MKIEMLIQSPELLYTINYGCIIINCECIGETGRDLKSRVTEQTSTTKNTRHHTTSSTGCLTRDNTCKYI